MNLEAASRFPVARWIPPNPRVTMRGKLSSWFNGQMQYTLSRGYNDTYGIGSFPANDYDVSDEWARPDFDRRHRFNLLAARASSSSSTSVSGCLSTC